MGEMTIIMSDGMEKEMDKMIDNKILGVKTRVEILRGAFIIFKLVVDELVKGNKIAIADKDNVIIKEIIGNIHDKI